MRLPRLSPCPSPSAQRGEHRRAAVFFFLLDAGSSAKLPGGERLWPRIYLSSQREVAGGIRRNPKPHAESSFRPRARWDGEYDDASQRHDKMCQTSYPHGTGKPPLRTSWRQPRAASSDSWWLAARAGRCRLHQFAAIVASGGQVRSGQHQQSGKEGPEHQAD
jgi:hypothetical protein